LNRGFVVKQNMPLLAELEELFGAGSTKMPSLTGLTAVRSQVAAGRSLAPKQAPFGSDCRTFYKLVLTKVESGAAGGSGFGGAEDRVDRLHFAAIGALEAVVREAEGLHLLPNRLD